MHGTVGAVYALQKAGPARRARRPLRRPGDRQAGQLRARRARSCTPTSTRPRSARTGPPTCRSSATRKYVIDELIAAVAAEHKARPPGRPDRLVAPARRPPRPVPARLGGAAGRHARAAVRHQAHRRDRRTGRDLRGRRRPAPDVGVAVHLVREAGHLAQLRRPRHDGLRGAGRDGRQGRHAGHHGLGDRRRRLLPDDQPGAGHLRAGGHPDQGRHHQQRQPRHGPAVADAVLQRALLQHRSRHAQAPHPRLREAGRGARLRRPAVRDRGRRRQDDRGGDGDQRRARS